MYTGRCLECSAQNADPRCWPGEPTMNRSWNIKVPTRPTQQKRNHRAMRFHISPGEARSAVGHGLNPFAEHGEPICRMWGTSNAVLLRVLLAAISKLAVIRLILLRKSDESHGHIPGGYDLNRVPGGNRRTDEVKGAAPGILPVTSHPVLRRGGRGGDKSG